MLKKLKIIYILSALIFLLSSGVILAQNDNPPPPGPTIENPIESDSIEALLAVILNIIVRVGMPLIILAFIYSGFKFIEARGNPAKLETAKTAILWTAIGAAVLIGAKVLGDLIGNTVDLL